MAVPNRGVSIPFMNHQRPPVTKIISYPFLSIIMLKFNTCPNKTLTLTHLKCSTSPQPSPSSLRFDSTSLEVSYLINNLDFSPPFASKLCSTYRIRFKTTEKPDSVLNFFINYGFSISQLRDIIAKSPWLLSCNLYKRVLRKFEFFLSKGASNSDILNLVGKNSRVLSPSLENYILPTYELLYRFLQSDKDIIASAIQNPCLLCDRMVPSSITMLIENGVSDSNIATLLRFRNQTLQTSDMLSLVEELKDLAKTSVTKTRWKEKVEAFKKWGWSDEDVIQAFKNQPHYMVKSIDKINLVMNFWVNQLGWDALALVKQPTVFCLSLEKRIIPRASVVQFLLNNGLRNKNASLTSPFMPSEEEFLDRFIKRFEESSYLLKLYEEKLKLAYTRDKNCMS